MPSSLAEHLLAIQQVDVLCDDMRVGTLARSAHGATTFEYAPEWLDRGFSISPSSLPLREGSFETKPEMQDDLFGAFHDSVPDDWGRLLQDRRLAELGVSFGTLTGLARLALVGSRGLGALEYVPSQPIGAHGDVDRDWDLISQQCQDILDGEESEALDSIYAWGSTTGGARPKVMVDLEGEPWIIKFPSSIDGPDVGAEEYRLMQAARACGIKVSETRLIPSRVCGGYFATKRFDRTTGGDGAMRKIHMASAAALFELSPIDVLDYRDLMLMTLDLTGDASDCEQLFRVMCFNVAVGNLDDHARNFSYLHEGGAWRLSPAYDLTRDEGCLGGHATLVNGKGKDITRDDLLVVGAAGEISASRCRELLRQVEEVLGESLA